MSPQTFGFHTLQSFAQRLIGQGNRETDLAAFCYMRPGPEVGSKNHVAQVRRVLVTFNHNLLQQLTSPGQLLCLYAKDSIKILQSTKINSRQTAEDQSSVQVGKKMRFRRFYGLLFVRIFRNFP